MTLYNFDYHSNLRTCGVTSFIDPSLTPLCVAPLARRWAQEVVEECSDFPNGTNDDQTDAMTLAIRRFRTGGFIKLASDVRDEEVRSYRTRQYY